VELDGPEGVADELAGDAVFLVLVLEPVLDVQLSSRSHLLEHQVYVGW